MYDIVTALKESPLVLDVDLIELIDEHSVQLIKIKATLKNDYLVSVHRFPVSRCSGIQG